MSVRGEHHTLPLSVVLKREVAHEKIEKPELVYGQAGQSNKGEDFTLVKTYCQTAMGDGVATFSVLGILDKKHDTVITQGRDWDLEVFTSWKRSLDGYERPLDLKSGKWLVCFVRKCAQIEGP